MTIVSALSRRAPPLALGDQPLRIIGVTLLSLAAINYWAYDRFLLSYVLATQCHGCDAPLPGPSSLRLLVGASLGGSYLALLIGVRRSWRRAVWASGTLLIALTTTLLLAIAHAQAVAGNARWSAIDEPVRLATYCGAGLILSTLVLLVRGPARRANVRGIPGVVLLVGGCLLAYGAGNWNRAAVSAPMAKAALLLAGTADVMTWWTRSLCGLLAVGVVLAIVARGSAPRSRWQGWPWLVVGMAGLWLTAPHLQDAREPLPLREAAPEGLSRVGACLADKLPEAVPLEVNARGVAPGTKGYLALSFATPVSELRPLLSAAMSSGINLVVIPAKRSRSVPTHTLGTLYYEDVCWGGSVRLSSTPGSQRLSSFATLGDVIASNAPIDPAT